MVTRGIAPVQCEESVSIAHTAGPVERLAFVMFRTVVITEIVTETFPRHFWKIASLSFC